jgi:dolichyl-phosphate beta-glucosyltransferase
MSTHLATPTLSVVVPAYNEEARIGPTVQRIVEYCAAAEPEFELIVVDDGSTDRTVEVVREAAAGNPRVRVIELGMNRGKGAAVRAGMLGSYGAQVLFSDADLATPIEEVTKLQAALAAGHDVAVASRALADSQIEIRQHLLRELMGRTFNLMVRALALGGIRDTQCGFKLFTRAATDDLFTRASIDGFAFDVEILWLAHRQYRIAEIPVVWRHIEESKVSPGHDAARMFVDLVRIRLKHLRK